MAEKTSGVWTRLDHARRLAIVSPSSALDAVSVSEVTEAAFVFGFTSSVSGDAISVGPVPLVVRPLRLGSLPLRSPLARRRQPAVREIAVREPRITRLWERFSIDVGVAVERDAAFVDRLVFSQLDRGFRVLIIEDGDRYAIRACCIYKIDREREKPIGQVIELLHDRSVAGMRGASHLLAIAVGDMTDAGAHAAHAWSFPHSGSFPIFAIHGFCPVPMRLRSERLHLAVRAIDPEVAPIITRRESWYLSYLDTI
jgi:hypothetical protein